MGKKRTEEQKRAVALVRRIAENVIAEIDQRPPETLGTVFAAKFHFDCIKRGPIEKNYWVDGGVKRPLHVGYPIFCFGTDRVAPK